MLLLCDDVGVAAGHHSQLKKALQIRQKNISYSSLFEDNMSHSGFPFCHKNTKYVAEIPSKMPNHLKKGQLNSVLCEWQKHISNCPSF